MVFHSSVGWFMCLNWETLWHLQVSHSWRFFILFNLLLFYVLSFYIFASFNSMRVRSTTFFRVAWLSQLNQHIVNLSWNGTADKPIKSEKKFNPKDISYVPNWCDIVFLTHKAQFKLLYVDDAHENIFSPHRFSQSHFALYYLSYKVSFQLKLGKFSRLTLDRMAIVTCSYPFHSVACKFKWANDNCFY